MTEIALALAMGFFSLMVLTLISMGTGQSSEKKIEPLSFAMASATTTQKNSADNSADQGKQILIIFDGKQFLLGFNFYIFTVAQKQKMQEPALVRYYSCRERSPRSRDNPLHPNLYGETSR